MTSSKIPGFYRLNVSERRERIARELGESAAFADSIWDGGGLGVERADQIVENVLGIYSLPFGVALYARMNQADRLIPMVVEEPSVIAAASNACKMVSAGGGFTVVMHEALMIAQVELRDIRDVSAAISAIEENRSDILASAAAVVPGLVRRGGGPRGLEVRNIAEGHLVVHLLVDCRDAMGANLVNTAAEHIGPLLAELSGGTLGLCILSNLSDRRVVHVRATVPLAALKSSDKENPTDGAEVARSIEAASIFAERDPYRAVTHNKGIMNGIDSVVLATGNDYRAVEAGAHAFAASSGTYRPLATWHVTEEGLVGEMKIPLALGIVGGTLRVHDGARLALRLAQATSADDLAGLAACAGLASNLAALRALATEGIQKGHMSLHARSVALAAGAIGDEVNHVAVRIAREKDITVDRAKQALASLRNTPLESGGNS